MEKISLLASLGLFALINAQQTNFGLKSGYTLSSIESQDSEESLEGELGISGENKSKSGYFVGAFVEHFVTSQFAIQGEVQYANLGGQIDATFNQEGINFTLVDKINFNQILIPISAKYFVTPEFAIFAGPSVAFNVGYKTEMKLENHNIPSEFMAELNNAFSEAEKQQDDALEENLKSTAFNLFLGGEYNVYKGLFLDARYTLGLTNYIKNPEGNEDLKMNYFQVGLGYKF